MSRDNFDMTILLIEHDMKLVSRYLREADRSELRRGTGKEGTSQMYLHDPRGYHGISWVNKEER